MWVKFCPGRPSKKSGKHTGFVCQEERAQEDTHRQCIQVGLSIIWIARSNIKYFCLLKVNLQYSYQTLNHNCCACHGGDEFFSRDRVQRKEHIKLPLQRKCSSDTLDRESGPSVLHLEVHCCLDMWQQVEIKNRRNIWDKKMSNP